MRLLCKRLIGAVLVATLMTARLAFAEPEPAVDVVIREPPPPQRRFVVSWNPLPLVLDKISFDVVVVPTSHHGLVLSPFYASTSTAPIFVFNSAGQSMQLAKQTFRGGGGELGYRYYFGQRGPRGLFLGPSLILASFEATAGNGTQTHYLYYGGAIDVGYQMLIANRVSLSLGGGLQVVGTSKPIPQQQLPAKLYANFGVLPRLLVSLGVAF
jgi:hypothetical protein